MLKKESKVIDGVTYEITQLPAMRSMKLFARAGSILGPALAKLAPMFAAGVDKADVSALGGVAGELFSRLGDAELDYLFGELFWSLMADGKPLRLGKEFEVELAGSLVTIVSLLRFAFEVNYGDFFAVAGSLVKKAPALAPQASK